MTRGTVAIACFVLIATSSIARGQVKSGGAPEEMKKLAFLEGTWQGKGRITRGPNNTHEADVTESGQFKLQGTLLQLEGRGVVKNEDGTESIVHDALALIGYDSDQGKYVMRAWRAGGTMIEPTFTLDNQTIVWSFDDPRAGTIRFTLTIDEDGTWHESGEASPDKQNWFPFFEMSLRKK